MDYKSTLNLPQTTFPMKANLPQREPEFLLEWAEQQLYHKIQDSRAGQPLYILHDGPPYANGHIHIGHALNKILKDIIMKSKTMEGYRVPYIPGWDCHGLPIEHQVTRQLGSKKKTTTAKDLRRLCRDYAEKFYKIQREEFERLGILGDWAHPYLTMNKEYEATIIREFGKFVEQGSVYKSLKPVLWCTQDQTALAEAEVEYEDHTSPSIYVRFPFAKITKELASKEVFDIPCLEEVEKISIVIWTTTPWTLPANQAVALHPEVDYAFVQVGNEVHVIAEKLVAEVERICGLSNPRVLAVKKGKDGFEGLLCERPLTLGLSPILLGEFVTLEQGTGCVHIAPGHGIEDYQLSLQYNSPTKKHHLPRSEPLQVIVPVNDYGCFTDDVKDFAGQHVLKANSGIVEKLQGLGLLTGQGKLDHSYPHCWRCKTPVIFRATQQWFVSMEKGQLRERVLKTIEKVQWIPSRGYDRISGMITNRPDWCLSRQRTWGTPIPVFTCMKCEKTLVDQYVINHIATLVSEQGADVWFERSVQELLPQRILCQYCGNAEFKKEQDILDVWFESGVSHAAVVKSKGNDWWPANLYLEGSDQHRGWFQSALLASVTTEGQAPYQAVLTHGFVVDGQGKKMSKSAGNVVTPQEVIKQYGAEILRLWVAAQDYQEDLRISQPILKQLVESYRKIRNTCRYLLSNIYDFDSSMPVSSIDELPELDRWALMRLNKLIKNVRQAYAKFEFRQIIHELDYFCAVDMSATYLDILKDRLYTFPKDSKLRRDSQMVLAKVVEALAKLVAPILIFTSEEIWKALPRNNQSGVLNQSIHMATFPELFPIKEEQYLEKNWNDLLAIRTIALGALEQQRRDKIIGSSLEAKVMIYALPDRYTYLQLYQEDLATLFIVSQVDLLPVSSLSANTHLLVDSTLELAIDVIKADGEKCERCWNYRSYVGVHIEHPTLCDRCIEAVT